ncbi:hypothetical protein TDB9533_02218 [Thalassocella blandensis]|nr:hypothetical protein TDB9533_02218 [Thalassocella blandensis]
MIEQITTMLEMQDAMNSKVHPQWREQGYAWYRAIWVECAELMDHYGWKWWKKQEPDMDQVTLELIDIWHFGLSICLTQQNSDESLSDTAGKIAHSLNLEGDAQDFRSCLETFTASTLQTQSFNIAEFGELMKATDLDFEHLYRSYVGKNVLNFFRQDHGYKDGSYRKIWSGKEDNEHLVEVLAEMDALQQDFKQALYDNLKQRYEAREA